MADPVVVGPAIARAIGGGIARKIFGGSSKPKFAGGLTEEQVREIQEEDRRRRQERRTKAGLGDFLGLGLGALDKFVKRKRTEQPIPPIAGPIIPPEITRTPPKPVPPSTPPAPGPIPPQKLPVPEPRPGPIFKEGPLSKIPKEVLRAVALSKIVGAILTGASIPPVPTEPPAKTERAKREAAKREAKRQIEEKLRRKRTEERIAKQSGPIRRGPIKRQGTPDFGKESPDIPDQMRRPPPPGSEGPPEIPPDEKAKLVRRIGDQVGRSIIFDQIEDRLGDKDVREATRKAKSSGKGPSRAGLGGAALFVGGSLAALALLSQRRSRQLGIVPSAITPPVPTPTPPPRPRPTPTPTPTPSPFGPGARLPTVGQRNCEIVQRRRRRKGKCREGFFREKPNSTEFITWRTKECQ